MNQRRNLLSCFNGRFLQLFSFGRASFVALARELSPSMPFAVLNLLFFTLLDLSERALFARDATFFLCFPR
jgi:hypothetical protein